MARQYGSDEQARRRRIDRSVLAFIALVLATVVMLMEADPERWPAILAAQARACHQLYGEQIEVPEGQMLIHMIDVGQGDSVLVQCDEANILIDAGEKYAGGQVVGYLDSLGIKKLDWVVCTHPHSDHIGGMPQVLDSFEVERVMMPEIPDKFELDDDLCKALDEAVRRSGARTVTARPGRSYKLGDMTMKVLWPTESYDGADLNDWSIVLKFSHGTMDFLCCGDMTDSAEDDLILSAGIELEAEIVKSSHHGSTYSNGSDYLFAVLPELALISCGLDNDYGHPHDGLLERYSYYGIEWKRTDVCGDIRVVCENGEYTIETQN